MVTLRDYVDSGKDLAGVGLISMQNGKYVGRVTGVIKTKRPVLSLSVSLEEGGYISELAWGFYQVVED